MNWLRRKAVVGGDIGRMGLSEWWLATFSQADRDWMSDTYAPMGGTPRQLTDGPPASVARPTFHELAMIAPWLSKPGYEHCAVAFADKAMEFCDEDLPVLDRHFGLFNCSSVFYRWRDVVPGAMEKAIDSCERCISFHEDAAKAFLSEYRFMAKHPCFDRLRIIEEKRGNYARALSLCEMAEKTGWIDDWTKHKARIQRKLDKR